MSLIHYIDNEPPWTGPADPTPEWSSLTQAGGSTIARSADAAFPERGSYGLRAVTASGGAYVAKTVDIGLAAAGSLCVGIWVNLRALHGSSIALWLSLRAGGSYILRAYLTTSGQVTVFFAHAGGNQYLSSGYLALDRWYYLVVELVRSSADGVADGGVRMYLDGVLILNGVGYDNYDEADDCDELRLGPHTGTSGFECDFDEIKVATPYPEPYVPTPADEYPSPERTVVLWRQASGDAREFADYCVTALGIPRANLIPVAVGSAEDTNVAGYGGNVRDAIEDYFDLNPTVAENCTCFLIGHATAGLISAGGNTYSMATCLMRWPETPSFPTANPLYAPAAVERLTLAALREAGLYLACRIDADTLAHAKDIVDRAAAVSALAELTDDDMLYGDDSAYLASVGCQRLRTLTAALGTYADDAFVWGDCGSPSFGSAGSRACFTDDSADSADTLRATTSACGLALHSAGYAAALGNSDAADAFDAASFFEMLRIGGTLAEAFAVAIANLDYTAVPVGSPLMTVSFRTDGYNLYRGIGGIENVDFAAPVAYLRPEETLPARAGLGHAPSTRHAYVVRPVRGPDELVTPDLSCAVELQMDAEGDWCGDRPAGVDFLTASVEPAGEVTLRWTYTTPYGAAAPADFCIYYASGPDIAPGSPQATQDYTSDTTYAKTLSLTGGGTYYFAVTARSDGGVESHLSEIIGPVVADATAPAAPDLYVGASF